MPPQKDSIPLAHSAKIIGCGQTHFFSQKSGLSFPAFLIQFSFFSEETLHHYYQWRSKKSFLLLKREKTSQAFKDFPKNAFSNLCDQASLKPWLKPLIGQLQNEEVAIALIVGSEVSHLGIYLSAYQPRMKKSIMRLEDFINNYKATNNWARFCCEEDSDNVRAINSIENSDKDHETESSPNQNNDRLLAAKLGQYFTSKEIARKVRTVVVYYTFVRPVLIISNTNLQVAMEAIKHYKEHVQVEINCVPVFVEPSCGDGRILLELLHLLSTTENLTPFLILAYDIDENVIIQCRDNLAKAKVPSQLLGMEIICCNFLEVSRDGLASQILSPKTKDFHLRLIFLGNPPYTSGAGSGKDINRHLPFEFITRCIELGADFVSFVVPERSTKTVEDTRQSILRKSEQVWNCHAHKLDKSIFCFQGQTVTQPSIIQCWSKAPRASVIS
jgi:hypothetical protein